MNNKPAPRTTAFPTAILISIIALCIWAPAVSAGLGLRAGLTMNPDQVHVGGHLDLGPVADRFSLRPNVEIGFGDDVIVVAANLETTYRFQSRWTSWSPYVGGGVGVNFVDPDNDSLVGDSRTETGILLLAGLERGLASGARLFLESKVGLTNAPDLKFTVGWTFGGSEPESDSE